MWFGITDMIQIACQISLLTCLAGCNGGKVCAEKSQCLNMHRHGWYTNFQCDKWKCKTFQRCYDNSSAHWLQGNSTLPKEALGSPWVYTTREAYFFYHLPMHGRCMWLTLIYKASQNSFNSGNTFHPPDTQRLCLNWFQYHLCRSILHKVCFFAEGGKSAPLTSPGSYFNRIQAIHCLCEDIYCFPPWGYRQK